MEKKYNNIKNIYIYSLNIDYKKIHIYIVALFVKSK